jgi:DNA-binding MarR family transcriptional regulator
MKENKENETLDYTDLQLLDTLQRDASLSNQTLAERLGLSAPTCLRRVRRLHALGLVNRLSNPGDALGTALQLADRLNHRAPNALASIKELLSDAAHQTLSQHLNSERDHFVKNLHHPNAGEGIAAFLEKRAPRYE